MARKKEILFVVVFVVLGGVCMLALLPSGPHQSPASHSPRANTASTSRTPQTDDGYHDPRLDELRQRKAELDKVYEGSGQAVAKQAGNADFQDPFQSVGQLSDFDSPSTPPVHAEAAGAPDISTTSGVSADEGAHATPTTATSQSETDPASTAASDSIATSSDDKRTPPDADLASENDATSRPFSPDLQELQQLKEQVATLRQELADQKTYLAHRLPELADRIEETSKQTQPSPADQESIETFKTQLDNMNKAIAQIRSVIKRRPSATVATRTAAPASAHANVRHLYSLSRIEGHEAVLVGQKTGRTYRYEVGDRLAYGGTLDAIHGDTVILHWPSNTVMLSLY